MKGAYTLIIEVEKPVTISIKSLGDVVFDSGLWVYVGSAMGDGSTSLENRIRRHFRSEKTIYWHIDYLLATNTTLVEAIWTESVNSLECKIAQTIASHNDYLPGHRGFGTSDCKMKCPAHVFTYNGEEPIRGSLVQIFRNLDLQPYVTKDGHL